MPSILCCYSSINKNKQVGCSNVLRHLKTESQWKDLNLQILDYCQLLQMHHLGTFNYYVTANWPKFGHLLCTCLYLFNFDFIVL